MNQRLVHEYDEKVMLKHVYIHTTSGVGMGGGGGGGRPHLYF